MQPVSCGCLMFESGSIVMKVGIYICIENVSRSWEVGFVLK